MDSSEISIALSEIRMDWHIQSSKKWYCSLCNVLLFQISNILFDISCSSERFSRLISRLLRLENRSDIMLFILKIRRFCWTSKTPLKNFQQIWILLTNNSSKFHITKLVLLFSYNFFALCSLGAVKL